MATTHHPLSGSSVTKSKKRVKQTGEVFTPHELCLQMVGDIPEEKLSDPTSTYIDPSCGDGNFLFALHEVLTQDYGQTSESVMSRLYGVELMADNVEIAQKIGRAHV